MWNNRVHRVIRSSTTRTNVSGCADRYYYEPCKGHGLRHNPFNSIIAPRPIGWIGSISKKGVYNLAPYSFFNAFNYKPPIIGFSSVGLKDTLQNIIETNNFTWNLATEELANQMNKTSNPLLSHEDEFVHAGLNPVPSSLITSPRVSESPVNFECEVTQIVKLKNASGKEVDTWMCFGEVVAVHIDKKLITENGHFDTLAAHPILRGGGAGDYFKLFSDSKFEMKRPTVQ